MIIYDGNSKTPGYIMYRVDHLSDVKRDGVCIYCKIIMSLKILSTSFFHECINFKVSIRNKICRFIHLYRTPGQSQDEFYDFLTHLEMNLDDSFNSDTFLTTVIGVSMLNQANSQRVTDQPSNGVKLIFLLHSLDSLK